MRTKVGTNVRMFSSISSRGILHPNAQVTQESDYSWQGSKQRGFLDQPVWVRQLEDREPTSGLQRRTVACDRFWPSAATPRNRRGAHPTPPSKQRIGVWIEV